MFDNYQRQRFAKKSNNNAEIIENYETYNGKNSPTEIVHGTNGENMISGDGIVTFKYAVAEAVN